MCFAGTFCKEFQIEHLKVKARKPSKTCHQVVPAVPVDLGEFFSSRGSQDILRFLHLPGSDLLYSPGKAAGNSVSKVPGLLF